MASESRCPALGATVKVVSGHWAMERGLVLRNSLRRRVSLVSLPVDGDMEFGWDELEVMWEPEEIPAPFAAKAGKRRRFLAIRATLFCVGVFAYAMAWREALRGDGVAALEWGIIGSMGMMGLGYGEGGGA